MSSVDTIFKEMHQNIKIRFDCPCLNFPKKYYITVGIIQFQRDSFQFSTQMHLIYIQLYLEKNVSYLLFLYLFYSSASSLDLFRSMLSVI